MFFSTESELRQVLSVVGLSVFVFFLFFLYKVGRLCACRAAEISMIEMSCSLARQRFRCNTTAPKHICTADC